MREFLRSSGICPCPCCGRSITGDRKARPVSAGVDDLAHVLFCSFGSSPAPCLASAPSFELFTATQQEQGAGAGAEGAQVDASAHSPQPPAGDPGEG